jgi:hypothetical protein
VALAMAGALAGPVAAQTERQNDHNPMRTVGTGLGAAAAYELLRGNLGGALVLGAGAAYAGKKYEDSRKAQSREEARRYSRSDRRDARSEPIQVVLNDRNVRLADARPQLVGERVYVPLRGVLEDMGANVRWDSAQREVAIRHENDLVRLPVNGPALVNGQRKQLDDPAYMVNGRIFVPLRFLAETFGADVHWDATDRVVHIDEPNA